MSLLRTLADRGDRRAGVPRAHVHAEDFAAA